MSAQYSAPPFSICQRRLPCVIQTYSVWNIERRDQHYPIFNLEDFLGSNDHHTELNFVYLTLHDVNEKIINKLQNDLTLVLILDTNNEHGMAEQRQIFMELISSAILLTPFMAWPIYPEPA